MLHGTIFIATVHSCPELQIFFILRL